MPWSPGTSKNMESISMSADPIEASRNVAADEKRRMQTVRAAVTNIILLAKQQFDEAQHFSADDKDAEDEIVAILTRRREVR